MDPKGKAVVFASWGGASQDAERTCYWDPLAAATGARVVQDGPMDLAKFRTMAKGVAPDRNVADITIDFLYAGSADSLFEPTDTAVVDTSRIASRLVHPNGVRLHRVVVQPRLHHQGVPSWQAAAHLGRPAAVPGSAFLRTTRPRVSVVHGSAGWC